MPAFVPTSYPRFHGIARLAVVAALTLAGWQAAPTILRAETVDALNYLLTLGSPGEPSNEPGHFVAPQGVAYDGAGRLYVSDTDWADQIGYRVQVFGTNHQYLYDLTPVQPFNYPVGVAVDAAGRVIVADGGNDRVVVFEAGTNLAAGAEIAAAGVHGNFDPLDPNSEVGPAPVTPLTLWFPTSVALKPGTLLRQAANAAGRVAVVDNGNHRIVVLDSMLAPMYAFGGHAIGGLDSPAGSLEMPWGIAIDASGLYYVADSENNRVQVFQEVTDALGRRSAVFVRMFGSAVDPVTGQFGSDPGDMARPYGMAFDAKGRLWVAEPDNHRLMRIDVTTDVGVSSGLTPCAILEPGPIESHCVVVTSDGRHHDAFVLGARGEDAVNAAFQYPQAVAVSPSQGLAVADTDNHAVQIFRTLTLDLSFAGPGTSGPGPYAVHVPIPLSVSLANNGSVAFEASIEPSLAAASTGDGVFSHAGSQSIPPGETRLFTFTFTPNSPGVVSFEVAASGEADVLAGGHVHAGTQAIAGGTVPPSIGLSVTASSTTIRAGVGDTVTLSVRLRNTGPVALTSVAPAIAVSNPALVLALPPIPSLPTLPGMATGNLAYEYTMLDTGTVTFTVSATASYIDPTSLAVEGVTDTAPDVTVTVTADATAPTTTAVLPPLPSSGWYNAPGPLAVQLLATDNAGGAGVASITARVIEDSATTTVAGDTLLLSLGRQGVTRVRFSATDRDGNVEADRLLTVKIDSVAPDMGPPQITSALPPTNGWYRTDPTIIFVAGDSAGGSGLATITPPVTVTTNGANQTRTGVATDQAMNRSAEASATVNVDKIAPVLVCAPARPPNANLRYSSSVAVSCTAVDQAGLSGVQALRAVCSATETTPGLPIAGLFTAACTYSTEGVHTFLAEATDVAGNLSTATLTIRIDRTPPVLSCSASGSPVIWPPNHTMVAWNPIVTVRDAVSSATFRLVAFYSSEGEDGYGDGHTSQDMIGWTLNTPDTSGFVRAERSGNGPGRVYTLTYLATDRAGNTATCSVSASVPHDQGNGNGWTDDHGSGHNCKRDHPGRAHDKNRSDKSHNCRRDHPNRVHDRDR